MNKFPGKTLLLLFLFIVFFATGIYFYLKKHPPAEFTRPQTEKKDYLTSSTNFFFDFETNDGLVGIDNIKLTTAHSGKMACDLTGGKEYGPSVIKKIHEVCYLPIKKIGASVWIYPLTDNTNTVLTASVINPKNETVFWDGKSTENQSFPKNKWTKINAIYNLPSEKISTDDIIQLNIWNKGKTDIIIDDLEVVYGESAERRGIDTEVDANAIYEKRFVPQRNKPPFKIIYLEKQEIKNENSSFITPDRNNPVADFSPNDEFLVGNFIADKNNLDEIICIKKAAVAIFEYSVKKQQFQQILETTLTGKTAWNSETKKFTGDFNADGKTDVLIVNIKNSCWELFNLKNKNWDLILKGKYNLLNPDWFKPESKPFVSDFFSKDKNDALIILNKNHYSALQLNRKTNTFEEKSENLSPGDSGIFNNTSCIYVGNFDGDEKQEFLKLDTNWRFDFKLLDIDETGFSIINSIDFKGYPNDFNPKYYEFVKIISGKFINSTKISLLVIMRNCADNNFNGKHCNQFENLSTLPGSTQLYNLGIDKTKHELW